MSMMQFEGRIRGGKVGLICMLDSGKPYGERDEGNPHNAKEMIEGTHLPVLYEFFRRPAGQWGAWTVFRYLGSEHAPDMSVPLTLKELPRDAVRVPDQAALRYWLDNGEGKPLERLLVAERDNESRLKLGLKPRRIGGTDFLPVFTAPLNSVHDWMNPVAIVNGIILVDELPSGSLRVSDQSALKCWMDTQEEYDEDPTDMAYVVVSTHPNESAYDVHGVRKTKESALRLVDKVMADEEEDSELEVWVEPHRMKE